MSTMQIVEQGSLYDRDTGRPVGDPTRITQRQANLLDKLIDERLGEVEAGALRKGLGPMLDPLDHMAMTRADASTLISGLLETKPVRQPGATTTVGDVTVTARVVPSGTYTVVFDPSIDDRITLRLRDAAWAGDLPEGSQVAEFLSGSDNERDYTGFAFVVKGKARVWKRFREEGRPVRALDVLLALSDEQVADAGLAYAIESGRCYRCNRTLTVPASIHRGLGPVCAGVVKGSE